MEGEWKKVYLDTWGSQVLARLRRLSDTRPHLCTSASIYLPVTASLSRWHTRQDLHFHTQKPPGSHSRVHKLAKILSAALGTSPYLHMFSLLPDGRGAEHHPLSCSICSPHPRFAIAFSLASDTPPLFCSKWWTGHKSCIRVRCILQGKQGLL